MFKKIIIGLIAGVISGFFGAGGGMILVPTFIYLLKLDEVKARATSVFCILPMVIASCFFYYNNNYIDWKTGTLCAIGGILRRGHRLKTFKEATRKIFKNSIYNISNLCFSEVYILMIEILIGFVSGIVSGTGMGGGTILILLLSIFLGLDQHVAQATNLVFFIPTSIAAISVNIKEKIIDWKIAISISMFGVIGAVIGSKLVSNIDVNSLRKYFGIFIGIIAIHEIYSLVKPYILNKKRHTKHK